VALTLRASRFVIFLLTLRRFSLARRICALTGDDSTIMTPGLPLEATESLFAGRDAPCFCSSSACDFC
jgi:hypothetical protein